MFLDFHGLREQPFGVTPDLRFLYLSPGHKEALASLVYGLRSGAGFVVLVGQPGTGKTTLIFQMLEYFRNTARTAFVFDSQCDGRQLVRLIISDLGLDARETDPVLLHEQFRNLLLREAAAGRRTIVVVDEAQHLNPSAMESLRLLSNFETSHSKLVQFVLAGQPELSEKLVLRSLSQFRQRVFTLVKLDAFPSAEVGKYIEHRLYIAGYRSTTPLFTPEAVRSIATQSAGIPRNINNICFNALGLACANGQHTIDEQVIAQVVSDLDFSQMPMPADENALPSKDLR